VDGRNPAVDVNAVLRLERWDDASFNKSIGYLEWMTQNEPNYLASLLNSQGVKWLRLGNYYVCSDIDLDSPWYLPVKTCLEEGLFFVITFSSKHPRAEPSQWRFSGKKFKWIVENARSKIITQAEIQTGISVEDIKNLEDCYVEPLKEVLAQSNGKIMQALLDELEQGYPLPECPTLHTPLESQVERKITPTDLEPDNYETIVSSFKTITMSLKKKAAKKAQASSTLNDAENILELLDSIAMTAEQGDAKGQFVTTYPIHDDFDSKLVFLVGGEETSDDRRVPHYLQGVLKGTMWGNFVERVLSAGYTPEFYFYINQKEWRIKLQQWDYHDDTENWILFSSNIQPDFKQRLISEYGVKFDNSKTSKGSKPEDRKKILFIYLSYVFSFIPMLMIIGFLIALFNRKHPDEASKIHYRKLVSTVWISDLLVLGISVLTGLLGVQLKPEIIFFGIYCWIVLRSIRGMYRLYR
jgi:uncharacterized membrane protein